MIGGHIMAHALPGDGRRYPSGRLIPGPHCPGSRRLAPVPDLMAALKASLEQTP